MWNERVATQEGEDEMKALSVKEEKKLVDIFKVEIGNVYVQVTKEQKEDWMKVKDMVDKIFFREAKWIVTSQETTWKEKGKTTLPFGIYSVIGNFAESLLDAKTNEKEREMKLSQPKKRAKVRLLKECDQTGERWRLYEIEIPDGYDLLIQYGWWGGAMTKDPFQQKLNGVWNKIVA